MNLLHYYSAFTENSLEEDTELINLFGLRAIT